jgi:pantoate--beta-alanine ligase
MIVITNPDEMKSKAHSLRKQGKVIGLVPTMGALHRGHVSLIETARERCDFLVTSIFVNPIQFGPSEDFSKYPRPFAKDCLAAENAGSDLVFAPCSEDMYANNHATFVDVHDITTTLCGASRPGHFRGVATVVLKFFNIVTPQLAVFGQKDAQQCLVLRRMVRDLNCSVELLFAPTVRDLDGLALSSRNVYLSADERAQAPLIYAGLLNAVSLHDKGERSCDTIRNTILESIEKSSLLAKEYIDVVDMESVHPVSTIAAPALAAVAVRTLESKTRLIDNIVLGGTF